MSRITAGRLLLDCKSQGQFTVEETLPILQTDSDHLKLTPDWINQSLFAKDINTDEGFLLVDDARSGQLSRLSGSPKSERLADIA